MKRSALGIAVCITAVGLNGCSAAIEDESTGSEQSGLGECTTFSQSYYSVSGEQDVKMKPLSSHFCWLTRSSGDFDGGYNTNGLYVYVQSDDYWHLESIGGGGIGEARCTPRSCFSGDGVDDVNWISDGFGAIANRFTNDNNCDNWATNTWWGDGATVLMGHPGPGRTEGSGEYSNVTLSSNPFASSKVTANDCYRDNKPIYADAVSLFVGTPSGGTAAHYTGIPFLVSGNSTLSLGVYTTDAFCFFTHITGKFRGGGESERLYTVKETSTGKYIWYAQSTQGSAGSNNRSEGRCYYYHQWDL